MRITYDPAANALYIELRKTVPADSIDLEESVTADLDDQGRIIGIEILDARERLGTEALTNIEWEQLPLTIASMPETPDNAEEYD
jgi:uncharacterized protein YuzE